MQVHDPLVLDRRVLAREHAVDRRAQIRERLARKERSELTIAIPREGGVLALRVGEGIMQPARRPRWTCARWRTPDGGGALNSPTKARQEPQSPAIPEVEEEEDEDHGEISPWALLPGALDEADDEDDQKDYRGHCHKLGIGRGMGYFHG